MAPRLAGTQTAVLRRSFSIACGESILASCFVDTSESPCVVVVSSTSIRIVVVSSDVVNEADDSSLIATVGPALPHRIVTVGGVDGLGGTVVAVSASAMHWRSNAASPAFGTSTFGQLLVALGTSLGAVRLLLVDLFAEHPLVLATTHSIADDGGARAANGSQVVASMCFALTNSWAPETLFVATPHELFGFDVQDWLADLANQSRFDSAASGAPPLRRIHRSTRNCKLGAALKLLSPCTRLQASRRMMSEGGNEFHAVADGAVAAVLVADDGAVQYVIRTWEPVRRHASERASHTYHLGPVIVAARRGGGTNSSVIVVNDAQWVFNDTCESLDLILCGVELSKPGGGGGGTDVLSTSSGVWGVQGSSSSHGAMLSRLPSMGLPYASQSFVLHAPPPSHVSGVEVYGPYGTKDPWWGRLVGVLQYRQECEADTHRRHIDAPSGPTGSDTAVDATLQRWADAASWEVGANVVGRAASSFGAERRGFSTAATAGVNGVVVFLAGSDLVGVQLPSGTSSTASHPLVHVAAGGSGTAATAAANTPQVWYSFASAPMFCHPIPLLGGKSFFAVGIDETVHILAQQHQP